MARATAFRRSIELFIDQALSPQARSAALAAGAKQILTDLIDSGQGSRSYRRIVDGRQGAAEETVLPEGLIVYRFQHWATICQFAISFLVARSPERSGRYKEGFYFGFYTSADQERARFVPWRQVNPTAITANVVKVQIGNIQPYSRKVDVQFVGRKPLRFSVAPGLFDDCVREINRRFAGIAEARRQYTVDMGVHRYVAKRGKNAGQPVHSPAIFITLIR